MKKDDVEYKKYLRRRLVIEQNICDLFYDLIDNTTMSYNDIRARILSEYIGDEEFVDKLIQEEKYSDR